SIQPIVTVYVTLLVGNASHVALISGCVVAAAGFANVLAAPQLGKLSDRIGPRRVLLVCLVLAALVFIPQAFVHSAWQLMALRFALGLTMAGLLPSINTLVKRNTPDAIAGRVYSYNQSAQYLGNIGGSLLGGQIAAAFGIRTVFFSTAALLLFNALWLTLAGRQAAAAAETPAQETRSDSRSGQRNRSELRHAAH
ncbi:MAG: MFS transporter, partial [Alicyclobacillus sp.]|nr:MFS transporter [Alicyclobacillus sp.]